MDHKLVRHTMHGGNGACRVCISYGLDGRDDILRLLSLSFGFRMCRGAFQLLYLKFGQCASL